MRQKAKFVLVLPALVVAAGLAGCSSEPTCDYSNETYMAAKSVPPLHAPEGLSAPDTSASLTIPATGPTAKPVPTGKGRCLDRPPSYFGTTTTKSSSTTDTQKNADKK